MIAWDTAYGRIEGITGHSRYRNGALKSCMVNRENQLETPVGLLVPQYRAPGFGERQKKHRSSLDFYEAGRIKGIALDKRMPVRTPMGLIPAELVTFYPDGAVNRIFPLNGKIDGFWSEANERGIAEPIDFDLPVGRFNAKVISIRFYPGGNVKAVAVWPGEVMRLGTPLGPVDARAGFSLYEDGSVRSVEPARPTDVPTPCGPVKAFDPDIIGMHADRNSLRFDEAGRLSSLKTIHSGLRARDASGREIQLQPQEAKSLIDPSQTRTVPMEIAFDREVVRVNAGETHEFRRAEWGFTTFGKEIVLHEVCADCPGDETCCKSGGEAGAGGCSGCAARV